MVMIIGLPPDTPPEIIAAAVKCGYRAPSAQVQYIYMFLYIIYTCSYICI
jgi:hypothetical protein